MEDTINVREFLRSLVCFIGLMALAVAIALWLAQFAS